MILRPARLSVVRVRGRVIGLALLCSSPAWPEPLQPAQVPEPLRPWIDWVLRDVPENVCPLVYGSSAEPESAAERRCAWPSRLELELDKSGGRFTQEWRL